MRITRRILVLMLILVLALPMIAQAATNAVVTVDKMVVRKGPAATYDVLGSLSKGTEVELISVSDGIARIVYNGKTGYARFSDMELVISEETEETQTPSATVTPAPQGGTKGYVIASELNVYAKADTSSEIVKTLSHGDTIMLYSQKDGWAQIAEGYTFIGGLNSQKSSYSAQTLTVAASSLTVYLQPSASSEKLGSLKSGTKVNTLAIRGDWARIEKDGMVGYVKVSGFASGDATTAPAPSPTPSYADLSAVDSYAATARSRIYVYEKPSTDSTKLGYLNAGETITVIAKNDTWARIQKGSAIGYAKLDGLNTVITGETLSSVTAYQATVTKTLYAYVKPNDASTCLGSLKAGETVIVSAVGEKWAKVEKNGETAYVLLSGLQKVTYDTSSAKPAVTNATTKVYASASTSSTVLSTLSASDTVNVLAVNGSWARIEKDGNVGYCKKANLTVVEYVTLKSGSSGSAVTKLQKRLEELGYFDGAVSGNYSALTTAAVKRFQAAANLSTSGIADAATQSALYSSGAKSSSIWNTSLSKGSSGENVVRLQTRLIYLGYLADSADGSYGSMTATAVSAYQKAMGIKATGTADSKTLRSIFSSDAKEYAGASTSPDGSDGGSANSKPSTVGKSNREIIVESALAQLGKPYVYANAGPDAFDCSGLVFYAYKQVGITLTRSAQTQGYSDGTKIESIDDLKRGDIVCFNTVENDGDLSDHTGIYLGNGQFVHASSTGGKVVVSSISGNSYYVRAFSWGRRVLN